MGIENEERQGPHQMQSDGIGKLAEALAAFQGEMPQVDLDATVIVEMKKGGTYTFRYATLPNILKIALPLLSKHGLSIIQTFHNECLVTTLMHKSGQQVASTIPVDLKSGSMQDKGSRITYSRRYSLSPLLGIGAESDDDGNIDAGNIDAGNRHQINPSTDSSKKPKPAESQEEFSFKVRMATALKTEGSEAVSKVIGIYGFVDVDQITDPKMQEAVLQDLRKIQKKRISEKGKAKTTNYDWLKEMKVEKDRVGEEIYYEALAGCQVKKANELIDKKDQTEILKDLRNYVIKPDSQDEQGNGFPPVEEDSIPF